MPHSSSKFPNSKNPAIIAKFRGIVTSKFRGIVTTKMWVSSFRYNEMWLMGLFILALSLYPRRI